MTMKNILLITTFCLLNLISMAQNKDNGYDSRWKTVDSLISKKGLPQSALLEVNKIYDMAKRENNDAQTIKALIYRMNLEAPGREDAGLKSIAELEKEITTTRQPARAILQNILAGTYWNYFQNHRWQLYNRTKTVNFTKTDIATWDAGDFHQRIGELYLQSLQDEPLLQRTSLTAYDPILVRGNTRYLRPTLFDLLANRALDYFKGDERDLNRPAYAFELNDPMIFAPAHSFIEHSFSPSGPSKSKSSNSQSPNIPFDSVSLHFKALQLFQRLLGFHINDTRPDAFIDLDINRVRFVYQYATLDNKDEAYTKALATITDRYGDNPIAAEAWYLLAQLLAAKASRYNPLTGTTAPENTSNRLAYVHAKAICERVLAQKDSSEGSSQCQVLLNSIVRKELSFQTEQVNLPGQPFRSLVTWRNVSQLYMRLVKADRALIDGLGNNTYDDDYWKKLLQLPAVRNLNQPLPETGDYHLHHTEIKIDALPVGQYALIGSSSPDFSLGKTALVVQFFDVSAIAYINNDLDYFVLNRESGQPIAGAAVQVWNNQYDYKTSKYINTKAATYQTDAKGHFQLTTRKKDQRADNQQLEITTATDHLFLNERMMVPYYYPGSEDGSDGAPASRTKYERDNQKTFFFTDRAIYRPGQTVYFKGIVITRDWATRQSKILTSFPTQVILFDANSGKVDSIKVTTNDFGSYHGSFKLPENLLNGEFRIEDDSTGVQQSFSVEEYKRPKFYVEYTPLKGSFRVGDSIKVTGSAKAYSGNNIDGAQVKYRVVRQARFPYPWLFWRSGRPSSNGQEIAHGVTTTAADGSFTVTFSAIPDGTVSKTLDPIFEYRVSADITDINGETRSGETTAQVGYKVLTLSIALPAQNGASSQIDQYTGNGLPAQTRMPADSLKHIVVNTTNLSGQPETSAVNVSIYALKAPDRMIRQRYWQQPDQFVISEQDYLNAFPHDEYRDESKIESWARAGKVSERLDSSGIIPVNRNEMSTGMRTGGKILGERLLPGWYAIEARTTDKYGQEVKDIKYVELYDGGTGRPVSPKYNWEQNDATTLAPGDKAILQSGSSAADVFVIRKMERLNDGNNVIPLPPAPGGRRNKVGSPSGHNAANNAAALPGNSSGSANNTNPDASGNPDDPSGKFTFFTLGKDRKTTEFPISESDRGGFGILDVFIKDNRIYTRDYTVHVPWTNKDLNIHFTTFRDKTLPGSEEKWQVQITGNKAEKVTAEVLAAMYDVSLDQFKMQNWQRPDLYPVYESGAGWQGTINFTKALSQERYWREDNYQYYNKQYDALLNLDLNQHIYLRGTRSLGVPSPAPSAAMALEGKVAGVQINNPVTSFSAASKKAVYSDNEMAKDSSAISIGGKAFPKGSGNPNAPDQSPVQIRTNFNETAFFFPDLRTDPDGNISFSFTMPESLTRWKWMTLAHTQDLAFGYEEKSIITQKQLMVQPNAPRFLREGDRMELSTKIVNLTDSELTGQVELVLTDPTTGKTADGLFSNRQPNQYFTAGAHQSTVISFSIDIPFQYNRPLTYRIVAKARSYSDGEEATLPVVSNRMLVTESLPLNMPGNGTRNFKFEKLLQSGNSETLNNHALTVEFTGNPAWYAVQALPYLMEYPYECAEQTFNRFYANALASKIANSSPRIQAIFEKWKTTDTAALLSNLQKNQELKSVLLEETPWVLQAKSESQQKKNIALLFDMVRMSKELESAINKLQDLQSPNGGFVWFKGGPDNRYITQYILTGIGHLQKLNALPASTTEKIKAIVAAAIPYLDQKIKQDYEELKKAGKLKPTTDNATTKAGKSGASSTKTNKPASPIIWIGELPINYLYMRSFFSDYGIPGDVLPAVSYFRKQVQQSWIDQSRYMQGMIALSLFRSGDVQTAKDIMASLKQNAIRDEEKGMYWKGMESGYFWYQAPIETQALLIEAFREITKNATIDRDCKTWLLRQKQTRNWSTTRATADACYALLLGGTDWLTEERNIRIRLGDKTVSSDGSTMSETDNGISSGASGNTTGGVEAGTGYFKKVFDGPFVNPSMGNITVTMSTASGSSTAPAKSAPGDMPAWGAVYWQYFDNLDRITPPGGTQSALHISKRLFIERNTDRGPVLEPVSENATLHVGDKVKVRIEIKTDRDMEYVHMKDMRASCMEPVNVISQYKWQGGLGYYESTKDASTNFFFDWVPRGTYVFEYALFVNQSGNFSNGITNIECMYAPEFSSHSEGIRVNVEASNP